MLMGAYGQIRCMWQRIQRDASRARYLTEQGP
jgi:hypothetical protein